MDDLHRGLLVKTYISVAEADQSWSASERRLAKELVLHVWGKLLDGADLQETILRLSGQATSLKWYGLVRPFTEMEPLRDRIGQLETIVIRFANLVAKADDRLRPSEARVLHSLQDELDLHLRAIPFDEHDHQAAQRCGTQAVADLRAGAQQLREQCELDTGQPPPVPHAPSAEGPSLEEATAELERLIGMQPVKQEVESLTNYILLQRRRAEAGAARNQPEPAHRLHRESRHGKDDGCQDRGPDSWCAGDTPEGSCDRNRPFWTCCRIRGPNRTEDEQ